MINLGTVEKDLNNFVSSLNTYTTAIGDLGNSWRGNSYNNFETTTANFITEYSNTITNQMKSYCDAINYYEQYETTKGNITKATEYYNSAVANNDKANADQATNDIENFNNQLNELKVKIEEALSSAASTKLTATPITDTISVNTLTSSGDITYKKTRYGDTTVWYAVIPKDKMPQLAIANDNYDGISSEAPSEMAKRKNAKLGINFGLTGDPAGMIYVDGKLVNDTGNTCDETLYMTKDGYLDSVRNDEYSTQDIIDMDPAWASKGFYTIARDGEYVDENNIDPSLSTDKHPRTFIGQDYEGNYIVGVCDGRGENEAGLTLREVYDFVNTEVTDDLRFLFNGDGGGSSAFVYEGEKLNSDTDGSERERPDLIYWT